MIYAQAEITMVFRHKETIIATQNIYRHISMLYFIQCKQRRLYNDECMMKFGGGCLMGAVEKRGRPASPDFPTGSCRQDPSAYSEWIIMKYIIRKCVLGSGSFGNV